MSATRRATKENRIAAVDRHRLIASSLPARRLKCLRFFSSGSRSQGIGVLNMKRSKRGAIADVQFAEDVVQVDSDRTFGGSEPRRDHAVGETAANQR